ncbi:hypothetical protein FHW69_001636 [Luteibacter sp. Sphag1AF]|uniref:hypothetical protein n=1 Tax=Luteibacter sp. Sphag1AF TaxID=2587031 RepID=UPI0016078A73|nr:hypothetical protein [Luteibacter sp. Sphag1AF]MBB3227035.1 hypothetical protein [Luteibacter sp. Sphag1AF]
MDENNVEVVLTHISLIRTGDAVEHNGKLMTVSPGDIKCGFMGHTLFGDSYRLGSIPVRKINLTHAMPARVGSAT